MIRAKLTELLYNFKLKHIVRQMYKFKLILKP